MKMIKISLLIAIFATFAPGAEAGLVFEVHAFDEGSIFRIGELEMPEGVSVQLPGGPNKNCTASGEDGFPDCQPLTFRPDPKTFAGINGSSTGLTGEMTADSALWVIDMTDVPSLTTLIAGFVKDFGAVITDGEEGFQYAELYFDTRAEGPNAPNQLCGAAEIALLTFGGCFAAEDVLKLPTIHFEYEEVAPGYMENAVYYDPNNPGHGFDFNVIEPGIFIFYYGHTAAGERLWLISDLYPGEVQYGVPFELTVFERADGSFGLPGSNETVWGTITFTLHDCGTGHATFSGIDGAQEMDFVRLAGLPGIQCQ